MQRFLVLIVAIAICASVNAFAPRFAPRTVSTALSMSGEVAVTAAMVSALRAKMDAPMMECKKALTEAKGDMAKAEEIIRVKLGNKANKVGSRIAAEGLVVAMIDGGKGVLLEANCETDFVSKNPEFVAFSKACAQKVVNENPTDVSALSGLTIDGRTVEQTRTDLVGKIGENMSLRRFRRYETPNKLTSYLHGNRIGVIVEYTGDETAAKDVAMHIAAQKPLALTTKDVPQEKIDAERNIAVQKAAESGKPPEIVAKMVEGSVQKYLKEVSLLNQPFVKNDKITVEQMLKQANTDVKSYTLFVVGEGLEKKEDTFVAEVQAAAAKVAAAKAAAA